MRLHTRRMYVWTVLWLCAASCRTAYPAPSQTPVPPTHAPASRQATSAKIGAVHQMEQRCRTRLERNTVEASMAALDRVREVLGSSCDVATVDRDPLHWVLHCRSDALFESGHYELADTRVFGCRELGQAKVSRWQCVGAVFQALADHGAIENMGAAVIGHVDMQRLSAGSQSHLCRELMQSLAYEPSVPWEAVPANADDEQRQYANEQLAFCRAASVGDQLRRGMLRDGAMPTNLDLAVMGAGSAWLRSQPNGICPAHGLSWNERSDCLDARRVDLLVRFNPRTERDVSTCNADRNDPAGALYCLERCAEEAAVGAKAGSGLTTAQVPLFTSFARSLGLPSGFYSHALTGQRDRTVDLSVVCHTLGIEPALCAP